MERYYTRYTDAKRCWKILERLGTPTEVGHLLDPSCGGNVFASAAPISLEDRGFYTGIDLDTIETRRSIGFHEVLGGVDFLRYAIPTGVTHIVTNPPFSLAGRFVEKARREAPDALLALLLPVSFLGSLDRTRTVHKRFRPTYAVHMGRLRFCGPAMEGKKRGGAAMDYALVVWDGENNGMVQFCWEEHLCEPAPLFEGY